MNNYQTLLFGEKNTFYFLNKIAQTELIDNQIVNEFLSLLISQNYAISNAYRLYELSTNDFNRFVDEFEIVLKDVTKSGFLLRERFAKKRKMLSYSKKEYKVILAQYSITYNWSKNFNDIFNEEAQSVLDNYQEKLSDDIINVNNSKVKIFKIGNEDELKNTLISILESKTVLRLAQMKIIESIPFRVIAESASNANIVIKEILIKVVDIVKSYDNRITLFKTSDDILRYILFTFANEPFEGQILRKELKNRHIKIPTSSRKFLLNQLESIGSKKGDKFLTEDMFKFESYWKIVDKYLRYESSEKTRKKFPNYTSAIDLLYKADRSWTFNSRFSKAKSELDFDKAIRIASERPGFLMRNLLQFLREHTDCKTNAFKFIKSEEFRNLFNKHVNKKLAWQMYQLLSNKKTYEEVKERFVQGARVSYDIPKPGVNNTIGDYLKELIATFLDNSISSKVYIDKDSREYTISYSGRSMNELTYSGEFLPRGTRVSFDDLFSGKKKDSLLRMGVMWRGKEDDVSIDIDLSTKIKVNNKKIVNVYYGKSTYKIDNKIVVSSSGDITYCGAGKNSKFSSEFIDVDINALKKGKIKSLFNNFISFSGGTIGNRLECYCFFSIIDKNDRVIPGTNIDVNLSQTDYAIAVDPDGTERAGAYIGISANFKEDYIEIINLSTSECFPGANQINKSSEFDMLMKNTERNLTLSDVFRTVLSKTKKEKAEIVISRKSREELELDDKIILLHPGRDMEKIQGLIF
jgi:hypothetical protein